MAWRHKVLHMQRSVEKKQWYVFSYLCHVTDNQVSEVWSSSGFPWIAANVFLRETSWQRSWATRTTRECAYVLKELAVWLSANSFSFWDPEFRLGGRIMLAYRDYLFADTRFANSTGRRLSIETTDRRLKLAFELCRYWLGEDESIRGERRALNKIGGRQTTQRRPPAFSIRKKYAHTRGKESLSPAELRSVWNHLYVEKRPPRRDKTKSLKQLQIQKAFWSRDCMLWAVMISTGLRRGEIPALMLEDIRQYPNAGWWLHLIDPRQEVTVTRQRERVFEYGADFKTGSRDVIVWFQDIFSEAYRHWLGHRAYLVALTGEPDHGMLFVSNQGGSAVIGEPMTPNGFRSFFHRINTALGPFRGDSGSNPFYLSPHRVRHTLETVLKSANIPIAYRQATLGHKNPETTEQYGSLYRTGLIAARNGFGYGQD